MNKIRIDGKYTYRNGQPAWILCVDAPSLQSVISVTEGGNTFHHTDMGEYLPSKTEHLLDLIEVKQKKSQTFWVNIYEFGVGNCIFDIKKDADACASTDRLDCQKITITWEV